MISLGIGLGITDGGRAWTPASAPGLLAQYMLVGDTGTTVTDSSGNGNHATSVGGTKTSRGVTSANEWRVTLPGLIGNSVRTIQFATDFKLNFETHNWLYALGTDQQFIANRVALSDIRNTVPGGDRTWHPLQGPQVVTIGQDGSNPSNQTRYYGTKKIPIATVAPPAGNFVLNQLYPPQGTAPNDSYLGGHRLFAGIGYKGEFYFFALYNRLLTEAEIFNNVAYFNAVMAGRGIAVGDTWNKTLPGLGFVGDSISSGAENYANAYPRALLGDPPGGTQVGILTNPVAGFPFGIGGQSIVQSVLDQGTYKGLMDAYSAAPRTVLLHEGTNDMTNSASGSGTSVYNNIKEIGNFFKGAGYRIGVSTVLNRTGTTATDNTERTTCRNLLLADFPTSHGGLIFTGGSYADFLYDANQEPNLIDPTNVTYYADGVHPTFLGATYFAAGWARGLALLGMT